MLKSSSGVNRSKCFKKGRDDVDESRVSRLITLRPHLLELKSALLTSAVPVTPTQAAEHCRGIDRLAACDADGLKSQGKRSCRCNGFTNHSVNDLDTVVQELRTTARIFDNMLANLVDEVDSFKTNGNELSSDVNDPRTSLIAVQENQRRMEKTITSSRLGSGCYYR